jgi:hypothetical protein
VPSVEIREKKEYENESSTEDSVVATVPQAFAVSSPDAVCRTLAQDSMPSDDSVKSSQNVVTDEEDVRVRFKPRNRE